ncbi:MAG: SEC-C domain-containing protein [Candidatus Nanopelagicales bacterium]|nr:SEC-C domain-containing protein [Candidatus Nanopelagicales bacterium]
MPSNIPLTLPEIAAEAERVLTEAGPLTEDELIDALAASVELGDDPELAFEEMMDSGLTPLIFPLADGRCVFLPALLDGRVFTHALTAAEVEHDVVDIEPDLMPIAVFTDDERFCRLADGTVFEELDSILDMDRLRARGIPAAASSGDAIFMLPAGYLSEHEFKTDDLIGFRVTRGGFVIERATSPTEPPADLRERLHSILADGDLPAMLDQVIWAACAQDPDLFGTSALPLTDLLPRVGLSRHGDYVAPDGFDFGAWGVSSRVEGLLGLHDLDEDGALAVLAVAKLYEQVHDLLDAFADVEGGEDVIAAALDRIGDLAPMEPNSPQPELEQPEAVGESSGRTLVRSCVALLADEVVARATLMELCVDDPQDAAVLGLFAETLEPLAPEPAKASLRWLCGVAQERMGLTLEAEQTYQESVKLNPKWGPSLVALARFASDRGDGAAGLALVRRSGMDREESLYQVLEHFGSPPPPRQDIGRNEPCWCGSGRKYKQCHLRRCDWPMEERAAWLYQKAGAYLTDFLWRVDILEIARVRSRFWDVPESLLQAVQDPFVLDVVMFEGGGFEAFVEERGMLLPEDERLLAEQWLLIDRSLFDVESVTPGEGIRVRDVRTGDRIDVRERTASRQIRRSDFFCGRIVPAGDTWQIFGGLEPIRLHEREELIELLDSEPDPLELVEFLSRRFAPPVLQNTEGEPLLLCEARLRVSDPVRMAAEFDRLYEATETARNGDEIVRTWIENVVTHGMPRVRATLSVSGNELRVDANSAARFDRVLSVVRGIDPDATVLEEHRNSPGALQEAMSRAPGGGTRPESPDANDPEIQAFLAEFMRNHEIAWLDESIPALSGSTPREAAADPTRRDDLIRLLDSFPSAGGNPGAMDPDRLRAELGLS